MDNTNLIGLDKEKAKHLAEKLNKLLANYSIPPSRPRLKRGCLRIAFVTQSI